jgi:3',5'-cyclic AMP phosphodiesterase CpdA
MTRIIHLSDLHFGTVLPKLIEPLLDKIAAVQGQLLVVSGDLTQRAETWQFSAAADFLARIQLPRIIVPGNHDIPLWNIYRRFVTPLYKFCLHFGPEPEPIYEDEKLIIVGINTARSLVWKGGRISYEQMDRLQSRLSLVPAETFKIIVMHHPIAPIEGAATLPVLGRAREALAVLERVKTDLIMAGHVHHRFAFQTKRKYSTSHSILIIQAGTALSYRTRNTPNGFNVVDIEPDAVNVIPYEWVEDRAEFAALARIRFDNRGVWNPVREEAIDAIVTSKISSLGASSIRSGE